MPSPRSPARAAWSPAASLRLGCLILLMAAACAGGCRSTGSQASTGPKWRNPLSWNKQQVDPAEQVLEGSLAPIEGLEEYEAVTALYGKQQYVDAEKQFKKLAKKYKDKALEEDCLFMVGECQFSRQRYGPAQDSYDKLLNKYPSSRHLEATTRRLFAIATIWLSPNGVTTTDKLVQVGHEDIDDPNKKIENKKFQKYSVPFAPNFTDGSRPVFDTTGNALKALNSVWLHDPTGPLADDAIMMTAAYHLRRGDYREADHYFSILREEYPKSDHAEKAFVLGSHVKMMSYQGAKYDGKILDEADDLVRSTINLYPDVPQRPKLLTELGSIKDQAAARDWAKVELYQRKGEPRAVAMYCELILKDHPQSTYADKATTELAKLDPKYRNGILRDYPELIKDPDQTQIAEKEDEPETVPASAEEAGSASLEE